MAPVPPRTPLAPRPPWAWLAAGALVATLFGFGRLLPAYFTGDDFAFIGRYATFPFSEWPALFVRNWQTGLFSVDLREIRPLTALAFMLDAHVWGADAFGFRLTNLLLHAGAATLVGALAWEFTHARRAAILAAVLFALHPAAVPAVGWITGRVDVLTTLFLLGAAFALVRFRHRTDAGLGPLAALALCFAAALFTKESALVFAGLMFVVDFALGTRARDGRTWRPYLAAAIVLALYAACRHAAFGGAGLETIGRGLPSVAHAGTLRELAERQLRYVAHLLPPSAEWLVRWRDAGFPRQGADLFRVVTLGVTAIGASVAVIVSLRHASQATLRRRVLGLGLGWYLVTTLPLILTYFSARHLYPASVGLALVVALIAHARLPSLRGFALAASAVMLLAAVLQHAALTPWQRAAERSRGFAVAMQNLARDSAPGTLVFIDAPDLVDGAFCWSWAVPHALRPPFTPAALDARLVLLARPAASAFREEWRTQLPWPALASNSLPAHLIRLRPDGTVEDALVSPAHVQRAAQMLRAASRGQDVEAWSGAIAALRAQLPP